MGRFTVGPTGGVIFQDVTLNGFDESAAEAGSAALRIYEQRRKSEIWNLGVRASMEMGSWTPWLRVTANKERRDDDRFVGATPISLVAIGNRYDIPAYVPDNNFVTSSIGVNAYIMPRVGLSAAGYYISGRSGTHDSGANLVLSYQF